MERLSEGKKLRLETIEIVGGLVNYDKPKNQQVLPIREAIESRTEDLFKTIYPELIDWMKGCYHPQTNKLTIHPDTSLLSEIALTAIAACYPWDKTADQPVQNIIQNLSQDLNETLIHELIHNSQKSPSPILHAFRRLPILRSRLRSRLIKDETDAEIKLLKIDEDTLNLAYQALPPTLLVEEQTIKNLLETAQAVYLSWWEPQLKIAKYT
jgi:hypothetical protein